MSRIKYIVDELGNGKRLDVLVSDISDDISRSSAVRLIEQGNVLLSGIKPKKNARVSTGDIVEIDPPAPQSYDVIPQNIPINILFEDDDIIVVNKQKGMVVHPGAGNPDNTLVNALLYHCGDSLSGIGGVQRPGIVHRIDKDTSGLLVVAKNDRAHIGLSSQLADHSLRRCYHAIVKGVVKHDEGVVDAPIARDKKNRLRMSISTDGRASATHYKVIERGKGYSYLELHLKTGRTHQIRVHMQSIGHSVAGDMVYGDKNNPKLQGQCLHAKSLTFTHPTTGEQLYFNTELPDYFSQFLRKIKA